MALVSLTDVRRPQGIINKRTMTEKEKMLSGELYTADDEELLALTAKATSLYAAYNRTSPSEQDKRQKLLKDLLGSMGEKVKIIPPFYCDYGFNISIGEDVFINMNCCLLDVVPITIGNQVLLGPNVQIYTATHPLNPVKRAAGLEYGQSITIEDNVWVGGGAIICPGVHVGRGAVVAAGAVVTKKVPENVLVGGNPAKVIKTELDLMD